MSKLFTSSAANGILNQVNWWTELSSCHQADGEPARSVLGSFFCCPSYRFCPCACEAAACRYGSLTTRSCDPRHRLPTPSLNSSAVKTQMVVGILSWVFSSCQSAFCFFEDQEVWLGFSVVCTCSGGVARWAEEGVEGGAFPWSMGSLTSSCKHQPL